MLKIKKNTGFSSVIIIVAIVIALVGISTIFLISILDSQIIELSTIYGTKEECENSTGVACRLSKCDASCPPNFQNVWRPVGNRLNASSSVYTSTTSANSVQGWKTYRNEKYGFEFKYPSSFKNITQYDSEISIDDQLTFFVEKNDENLNLTQWFNKNEDYNGKLIKNNIYTLLRVEGGSFLQMDRYPTEEEFPTANEDFPKILAYNYIMPDSKNFVLIFFT